MSIKTIKSCDWCDKTTEQVSRTGADGGDWFAVQVARVGDTSGNSRKELDCCPSCMRDVEHMRSVRAAPAATS